MSRTLDETELAGAHDLERHKPQHTSTEQIAHGPVRPTAQRETMNASSVLHLQRSIGNAGTAAYLQRDEKDGDSPRSPVHEVIGSGGSALDAPTRSTMEKHLGADLSDVRLHVDRNSAESVSAAAYTVGNDVVLHPDHYSPGTPAAQRTLAHELTHVVQQRSGPVDGTPREGGIRVSDPSDRFEQEAERSADGLVAASQITQSAAAPVQTLSLQRESEQDEAEVQEIALQRESEQDEAEVQEIALQRQGEEEEAEGEG